MESDVCESLQLQLSELEMLISMFPNEGDLCVTDPAVVSEIQDFLSGKVELNDVQKLEYTIHLNIDGSKVEVGVSLPHSYPFELPNISVYSSKLSRSGHDSIKNGLKSYLERIETGTLYITLTIEWIIENFASHDIKVSQTSECATIPKSSRLWIHSHHIYSKNKIESIKDWAEELNLSGFIMAGKPGLVCVEGSEENCQMWWQRVRSMNWQRITCKLQENAEGETVWRRFPEFTNITHKVTDMKAFLHFLESHNSHYVFKEFFGFDGK